MDSRTIFEAIDQNDIAFLKKQVQASHLQQKNNDCTPAQYAAQQKRWDCVMFFAENFKDKRGAYRYGSALLDALDDNQSNVALQLIIARASLIKRSLESKNTILHVARDPKIITLLLNRGLDFYVRNKENKLPIEVACEEKRWDCVQVFMQHQRCKYTGLFENENSILHLLIMHCDGSKQCDDIISSLLRDGKIDLNQKNKLGLTAFDYAIQSNLINYIELMLPHYVFAETIPAISLKRKDKENLRKTLYFIVNNMSDQIYQNETLADWILLWQYCTNIILCDDLERLKIKHSKLQEKEYAKTSCRTLDCVTDVRLTRVNQLIETIKECLDFPNKEITFTVEKNDRIEDDICFYLSGKKKIAEYVFRLQIFLKNLEIKVTGIKEKISFFDVMGHRTLNNLLSMMHPVTNSEKPQHPPSSFLILQTYRHVLTYFQNENVSIDQLNHYFKQEVKNNIFISQANTKKSGETTTLVLHTLSLLGKKEVSEEKKEPLVLNEEKKEPTSSEEGSLESLLRKYIQTMPDQFETQATSTECRERRRSLG